MLKNILKAIPQVLIGIVSLVSLFTAYIMFAPDDLPKPFRLVYDVPGRAAVSEAEQSSSPEVVYLVVTPTPEAHVYMPGEGVMANMSTKIINLLDPTGRRYIRVTIVVEFAPDNPEYINLPEEEKTAYLTQFEEKLNSRLPIMDDAVITLLSTKTYEDLYTAEGKENLRMEIMTTLSQRLSDLHIISIYFTEFVVQ